MTIATWAARLALAVVFTVAAVGKLRDLEGSRKGVMDLGVPRRASGVVTAALPVLELVAAFTMVVPLRLLRQGGAVLALALLAGFSVAITRTLAAGRHPACHCFGARSTAPLGPDALVRNGALAVLAVVVLLR